MASTSPNRWSATVECNGGKKGKAKAGIFVPVLNAAMGKYGIVIRLRIAAFITQIGHESGQLQWVRELGDHD